MLTPVTPNPIATPTSIRSHGSEARSTPAHVAAEAVVVQQVLVTSAGIGLETGSLLASVNAEAATAGNPTVLQTLATAVAAQLHLARFDDETLGDFFLRIADALDAATPEKRETIETKAGLKLLNIRISDLAAALRQPGNALAARLSAMAETPTAMPQRASAASATTTYLADAGVSRAAESLAMVTRSRANVDGRGIFSSSAPPAEPDRQPVDARSLQTQLKALFEPGIAETRMEIAIRSELPVPDAPRESNSSAPAIEPKVETQSKTEPRTNLGADSGEVSPEPPAEHETVAEQAVSGAAAETAIPVEQEAVLTGALEAPAPEEGKVTEAPVKSGGAHVAGDLPSPPQNTKAPPAATQLRMIARELARGHAMEQVAMQTGKDDVEHKMQTLLTLKGIAEVITALPAKASEFLMSPQRVADIKSRHTVSTAADAESAEHLASAAAGKPGAAAMSARRIAAQPVPFTQARQEDGEWEKTARAARADEAVSTAARQADAPGTAPSKTFVPEPFPFGFATLPPAKEEFRADQPEESRRDEDESEDSADQDREDAEERRERLARKAIDDLLRQDAEPDAALKITRDSSQADRAYALYQRMAGF